MMNEELAQLDVERRGYALAIEQPLATLAAAGKIRFLRWREDIQLKGPVFITSYARSTKIEAIEKAVREFCKDSTAIGLDYTPGSLHGRVFVDDCLTRKEFEQEVGFFCRTIAFLGLNIMCSCQILGSPPHALFSSKQSVPKVCHPRGPGHLVREWRHLPLHQLFELKH